MKMELFFGFFLERRNEIGIVFWIFLERRNENGIVFLNFFGKKKWKWNCFLNFFGKNKWKWNCFLNFFGKKKWKWNFFFGFFFGKKRNENGIVLPETEQFELTAPDEIFSNATKTPIFKLLNAESQIYFKSNIWRRLWKIRYLRCCFYI